MTMANTMQNDSGSESPERIAWQHVVLRMRMNCRTLAARHTDCGLAGLSVLQLSLVWMPPLLSTHFLLLQAGSKIGATQFMGNRNTRKKRCAKPSR